MQRPKGGPLPLSTDRERAVDWLAGTRKGSDRERAADFVAGSRQRPAPFKLLSARPRLSASPECIRRRGTPEPARDAPALVRQTMSDPPGPAWHGMQPVMPAAARQCTPDPLPDVAGTWRKVRGLASEIVGDEDEPPAFARNKSEPLLPGLQRSEMPMEASADQTRRIRTAATWKGDPGSRGKAPAREGETCREKGLVDATRTLRGTPGGLKAPGAPKTQHRVPPEHISHAHAKAPRRIERTRSRSASPDIDRQGPGLITHTRSRSSSPKGTEVQETPRLVRRVRRRSRVNDEAWQIEPNAAYSRLSRVAGCWSHRNVRICFYSWQLQVRELARSKVWERRAGELEQANDRMQRWLESNDKLQADKEMREAREKAARESNATDADSRVLQLTEEIQRIREESAKVIGENARRHAAERSLREENEMLRFCKSLPALSPIPSVACSN